jgi:thioredoxin 1
MTVSVTTDATFDQDVLAHDKPVLVDFWAAWCGPCRAVAPILEEISQEYSDKVTVVKIDADSNPEIMARYGITGLPTISLYQGGKLTKSITGARPKALLVREFSDVLE